MRTSHAATVLAAFAAGLTAAAVLRRLIGSHADAATPVGAAVLPPAAPAPDRDAVVLPFTRPVAAEPAPEAPKPARCGETGGLTKAGAPCAARATSGGRCHHHPIAA